MAAQLIGLEKRRKPVREGFEGRFASAFVGREVLPQDAPFPNSLTHVLERLGREK
jgi:hypothetical protein